MPKENFSYENLNALGVVRDETLKYLGGLGGKGKFVEKGFAFMWALEPTSKEKTQQGEIFEKYGLKFHISLPENDRKKYAEGWNRIKDILIDEDVKFFKVADENTRMSSRTGQQGKDITIYTNRNPEKTANDWLNILIQITQSLVENEIPPGYQTCHKEEGERPDTEIKGSKYISYRYEYEDESLVDHCRNFNIDVYQPYEPLIYQPQEQMENTEIQDPNNPKNPECCKKCVIL